MCSAKTVSPASIGSTLVSRLDTPTVAIAVPRWKLICAQAKARP
jgi:hypothetical protein